MTSIIVRGVRALSVALLMAMLAASGACRRHESSASPAPIVPPPPPPARPSEFVHPPTPSEPPKKSARAECSAEALAMVAGRLRETQARAAHAAAGAKGARRDGCGTPAMTQVEQEVKGALLDRVLTCVAQDEPYDPEWNLLESAMNSLGVCADCTRLARSRMPDCKRAVELAGQAEQSAKTPR